jgi:Secretion system C-terminal sorting domain
MRNAYSFSLLAASLLTAGAVSAQYMPTVLNASQRAQFEAKLNPVRLPVATDAARGGLPNDDCDGAVSLTVGTECVTTAGNLDGATESIAAATCSGFTAASASDVWFSFVATGTTTVIEVTGGGDADTGLDPVVEAFGGSCVDLGSLGCVDATLLGATESLTLTTVAGTTYYYRVYYWPYAEPPAVFDFTTCVYTPTGGPANDLCTNAVNQALSVGGSVTFTGDNTGALNTEGLTFATVWESFTTTTCTNLALTYCGTDPVFGNAFLSLWLDCPQTTPFTSAGFDQTTCPDGNVTIFYENVPAGTYYYGVLTDVGAEGPYTITVAATQCASPPGNDECENAMVLISNATCIQVGFTTDNATETLPAIECDGFTSAISNDVWFSFVATSTDQTIGVVGFNEADAMIELFSGACGALNSLQCEDLTFPQAAGENTTELLTEGGLTVGQTYYVRVYDWGHASPEHNFEICVTEGAGANIGIGELTGADAWSIYPNPTDGTFNLSYAGTNGAATVEVFDVTGRMVYNDRTALANGSVLNVEIGSLSAGNYNVRLTVNGERSEQRLMVK